MDSHARKFSAEESLLVAQQRIIELKAERDEECESARRYSELFATEKERADRLEAENARLRGEIERAECACFLDMTKDDNRCPSQRPHYCWKRKALEATDGQ